MVVIVILEPAASVNVSVAVSATTSLCPETDIVLNEYSLVSPPPAEPTLAAIEDEKFDLNSSVPIIIALLADTSTDAISLLAVISVLVIIAI